MASRKRKRACAAAAGSSRGAPAPGRRAERIPELVAETFEYTSEHHRNFSENGFVIADGLLSPEGLQYLRREIDEVNGSLSDECHKEWVMSLHQVLPPQANWMWALATHCKILDMLEQQLGKNLVLFSTQLATKPPQSGKNVPWHQDGERCRTVWITLDDVDQENGALRMMPGVFQQGRRRFAPIKTDDDLESYDFFHKYSLYTTDVDPQRNLISTCTMKAGGLEIHNPLTPHSSRPNLSKTRTRRAIIMRYQPASEPLQGGSLKHYRDGSEFGKMNYLVRGSHPAVEAARQGPSSEKEEHLIASHPYH